MKQEEVKTPLESGLRDGTEAGQDLAFVVQQKELEHMQEQLAPAIAIEEQTIGEIQAPLAIPAHPALWRADSANSPNVAEFIVDQLGPTAALTL